MEHQGLGIVDAERALLLLDNDFPAFIKPLLKDLRPNYPHLDEEWFNLNRARFCAILTQLQTDNERARRIFALISGSAKLEIHALYNIEPINGYTLHVLLKLLGVAIEHSHPTFLEHSLEIVSADALKSRDSQRAANAGKGRAAKFKLLEDETIRLYKEGIKRWPTGKSHVPTAALEITPKIVAFSKGICDLFPTTTKPLEWIRAHVKANRK
jgi:hypothetical protein